MDEAAVAVSGVVVVVMVMVVVLYVGEVRDIEGNKMSKKTKQKNKIKKKQQQ